MVDDESKEALTDRLLEMSCLGSFETGRTVVAYFPDTLDIGNLRDRLRSLQAALRESGLNDELSFDDALIPHKGWNESWKKLPTY